MTRMTQHSILLVAEILEDAIHNKIVSTACKEKIQAALNPAELKTFVMAMVDQLDKDERVKVVKFRNIKD